VELRALGLDGVFELIPSKHGDHRGFFSEVWSAPALEREGIHTRFCQDNHSFSAERGVLRGLHFQAPPHAQDKLVRVPRGAIFDVAVDIRVGSPSYGHWVGLVVSAEKWNQILVPKGFAHGFVTLEPETEVIYKVSAPYAPQSDHGIRFDDSDIAIEWPSLSGLILSAKDRSAPRFSEVESGFRYGEAR
jgi:dTDP-4-dehydrorhamnose 3,5-epimerase